MNGHRIYWLLIHFLLIHSVQAIAALGGERPPDSERPPNVLFLLTDDQRPDTIASLGNPRIRTPNLDRLVREGAVFTRAVAPNPLCVPSRAEILTGVSGFRNGVLPPFSNHLDDELVTWPEAMRKAGYHTWYVGKWHTSGRPSTRGYDEVLGLFGSGGGPAPESFDAHGRVVTGYRGWVFQTDDGRPEVPGRGIGLTPDISQDFADAAIRFIERQPDRPFFLHVNFTAPHDPLLVPTSFAERYRAEDLPLPENFRAEHPFDHGNARGRDELLLPFPRAPADVQADLAVYYAVIEHLDEQIGRILGALEATEQREDTIVIFASDHGLAMGSHGLRGKQNMYEHTINVPLVLTGPGVPKGEVFDAQVYLRDLYPTSCELAGVPVPETVEAASFARVLRGEDDSIHDYVFGHFADSQRMIRGDRWKLIRYPQVDREQLFDLHEDPFELNDLSTDARHAEWLARLRAELAAWQERVGDPLGMQ
jgi:arylsulfatase A-like enzyme